MLLSENWALTGGFRKFLQVLFNGRFTLIEIGEPVSLRSLLEESGSVAAQASRLTRLQRAAFRKQRAARIGPDLSHRRTIVAKFFGREPFAPQLPVKPDPSSSRVAKRC